MTATETRTANEAAALRAAAREVVGRSAYESEVARAVEATLDWLDGAGVLAPVTGEVINLCCDQGMVAWPHPCPWHSRVAPDTIARERLRAIDVEDRALRSGVDGTYAGVCAQVLSWWCRRPYAESPL